jgi:hypothetical protein
MTQLAVLIISCAALLVVYSGLRLVNRRGAGARRIAGDAGATLVEAAIITPIFLSLIIGMIEFGDAYSDQLALTSATRAAARLGSAEPRQATFAQDTANQFATAGSGLDFSKVTQLWVYKANSSGYPGSGTSFSSCASNCVSFTYNSGTGGFVQSGGSGWAATAQNACATTEDSIGVYVQFNHASVTSFFFSALTLQSHSVLRLEPIPTQNGCK